MSKNVCVMSLSKYLSRTVMWIILLSYKLMKFIHKQTFEGLSIISYFDHVREPEVYRYDLSVTLELMF
jgi:hypothetical protein